MYCCNINRKASFHCSLIIFVNTRNFLLTWINNPKNCSRLALLCLFFEKHQRRVLFVCTSVKLNNFQNICSKVNISNLNSFTLFFSRWNYFVLAQFVRITWINVILDNCIYIWKLTSNLRSKTYYSSEQHIFLSHLYGLFLLIGARGILDGTTFHSNYLKAHNQIL